MRRAFVCLSLAVSLFAMPACGDDGTGSVVVNDPNDTTGGFGDGISAGDTSATVGADATTASQGEDAPSTTDDASTSTDEDAAADAEACSA